MPPIRTRGFSLIGLLVTMTCILILAVMLMSSLNKAVTGEGNTRANTVRSFEDKLYLTALFQSMTAHASDHEGRFVTPSEVGRDLDHRVDTTASMYSAMLMEHYTVPKQLISANENSPHVWVDDDYDWYVYSPRNGVYWDPDFAADLHDLSNVSFAHMPLHGERYDRYWRSTFTANVPLIGTRGPRSGQPDVSSYTYGQDGAWAGHVMFADGHVEFIETFSPQNVFFEENGERFRDNIFSMEQGPGGGDAILSFTEEMTEEGPVLQWD
jgi:prepilin-type processing-associated H-X9-DG protein